MRRIWMTGGLAVVAAVAVWAAPSLEAVPEVDVAEEHEGDCTPSISPTWRTPNAVCGTVHGGAGAAPGEIEVRCEVGMWARVNIDADGRFEGWVEDMCTLTAVRKSGAMREPGSSVLVHGGEPSNVHLWVPDYAPAGLGFVVDSQGRGLLSVGKVYADTPAERAGFVEGQQILAVDGVSTGNMTPWEYIAAGVGPAGTEVTLTLAHPDGSGVHDVEVRRAPVPSLY